MNSTTTAADASTTGRLGIDPRRLATWIGILVLLYGALLAGFTSLSWAQLQPPGAILGPPSAIQAMSLRIEEGLALALFGAVALIGGLVAARANRRARGLRVPPASARRIAVLGAALALILIAAALPWVPPPQRTVDFGSHDFLLTPSLWNLPYEVYFVSWPFVLHAGEWLLPVFTLIVTDVRSGALVERDDLASVWFTGPSEILNWRDPSAWAWGAVVPSDGYYVLWVRFEHCESLTTTPCDNYTAALQGSLLVSAPTAYLPVLVVAGIAGTAAVAVAAVQSGIGRRRTTS